MNLINNLKLLDLSLESLNTIAHNGLESFSQKILKYFDHLGHSQSFGNSNLKSVWTDKEVAVERLQDIKAVYGIDDFDLIEEATAAIYEQGQGIQGSINQKIGYMIYDLSQVDEETQTLNDVFQSVKEHLNRNQVNQQKGLKRQLKNKNLLLANKIIKKNKENY